VSFRVENSRFTSSEAARRSAADDANNLITIAKERFGITLDGSENSIVDLQRVAELARGEMQPWRKFSEWKSERDEWARLLGSYLGEVLVKQHGAHWGATDFIGGSDRAIGFPKARNISLPLSQMEKALQYPSSVCGWYLIDLAGAQVEKVPDSIGACDKQSWHRTKAEEDHLAAAHEQAEAARGHELELRKSSRTGVEIREAVGRLGRRFEETFQKHQIRSSGKITVSFTVAPGGEVTEAHVVSSDFRDPALEESVLGIVRTLHYESREVPSYTEPGIAIQFSAL